MEELLRVLRQVLGDKASGIPDAMLEAKLLQLPVRLVLVALLAWFLLRVKPMEAANPPRLFIFQVILPVLGIYYTLDLYGYLHGLYSFEHPYQLSLFPRLFMGESIPISSLWLLEAATLLGFLLSMLRPESVWKLLALLTFALSESLVYAYGYTENTFTSFRLAQLFLFLYSLYPTPRMLYYGQAAILLCYVLPGMEKLLSFAFGLLNGQELKIYAHWFHLHEGLFRLVYGAGLVLQLSMLAGLRYGKMRKLAAPVLVSFHAGTALMGVGGITTPWIPALLFLLI